MKKLIAFSALLPGTALAHGGHAPLPAGAHEALHAGPTLLIGLAVLGVLAAVYLMRDRS
ncbi:MAG: hypothetical protein AAFT19_08060 [Pseudomonadota bacterium]